MQGYPDGGGYTPHRHHYQAAGYDYNIDDYLYNTPRHTGHEQHLPLPKQNTNSMDDYPYNTTHQMGPDQRFLMPKQNMMSMQRSINEWIPPLKNYHHTDGYGGYNQNTDNFKSWSGNTWPGIEQHYSVWSNRNGYPVPGEINGGYRAAINEQRPHYYEQTKAPPVWVSKAIID